MTPAARRRRRAAQPAVGPAAAGVRAPRASGRRGEQGSFVVLVAVLGMLCMAFWTAAYRATHDTLRGEAQLQRAERHAAFVDEGLRRACALLELVEPPGKRYSCLFLVESEHERGWLRAEYERGSERRWSVSVEPAGELELGRLPLGEDLLPWDDDGRDDADDDDAPGNSGGKGAGKSKGRG